MSGLELQFMVPPADLQPFVTLFYCFGCPGDFDDLERAGLAQLRFRLSPGTAFYEFADGTRQDAPPMHVVGPTTAVSRTCARGPVRVFGMGLSAAGWAALLARDASALCNRCVDAATVLGADLVEAADGLHGDADGAAMIARLAPWLRRRFEGGHGGTLGFVRAVDGWLASCASPAMDALVAATGLSRRHVERRCNALYGAPPKLLARKYRALRAAVAMASGEQGDWDGFYDQSHMIREVKHFTGLTPRRMRDEPGVLAALTIRERRALQGQVGPLVSAT